MFFSPIQSITAIQPLQPLQAVQGLEALQGMQRAGQADQTEQNEGVDSSFKTLLLDAVANVKETGTTMNEEIEKLATGQTDNLHEPLMAAVKYTTSVELMVQLRNKALDAYNELMRMGV